MPDYVYLLENRLSSAQQKVLVKVRDAARDLGVTVFLTGGAVRDLTTGFPVRDLDISVYGNALKLKKSLEKAGGILWGEHEPSRTLYFWIDGVRVEISSSRSEEYPKPGKPVYHWAPILDDLRRRDFTVNAMAISLNEGSYGLLLDPMNGIADLESRTLRLVSNYGFLEEPSRMLRAIRLQSRLGFEMDERTRQRYENAKEEGVISSISPYLAGYEIEEILHEDDGLKALRALETEGWLKHLAPAWTSAKADVHAVEALQQAVLPLLIQGIHPDLSAAQAELLTAKLQPKDLAALKKMFPRQGFVAQWENLEESAKEFQKVLLDKANAAPSATWRLLTSYAPEPVAWLAYTSKTAAVQTKFKNFLTVWPEFRQKIPTALMLEMRIVPELPGYQDLVQEIFFQLIDGKLTTEEEMRAFLEPHSPPAPPPPVSIKRTRGKKAAARVKDDDEDMDDEDFPRRGRGGEDDEDGDLDMDSDDDLDSDDDEEDRDESDVEIPPAPKPAKKAAKAAPAPAPAETKAPAPAAAAKKAEAPAPVKAKEAPAPAAKKAVAPVKTVAKKAPAAPAKKAPAAPAKKAAKPASKPAAKVTKPAKPAKVEKKPVKKPAPKPIANVKKKPVAKPVKKKR
ncbi:CCA tRNA nucleotidyltransferase [Silvibacterium acidisoli]|uniref:CCA tRNA nucleotidyltransferase n=1 Tax=Acidobacteriaceae bacterium ZG23-2 TaxID=2883246 RepID=UPI00406D0969